MNSYSKTFGYNIFSGNSVLFIITILPIMVGVGLAVFLSYMWTVFAMVYYFLLLAAGYWIRNHRESLIIDQSGITLTKLSGDIEYILWSDVGGYHRVTKGSGKNKRKGIGILDASSNSGVSRSEDYDDGPDIMFIETSYGNIAGSEDAIIKAVKNGIDCYVHHKRIITQDFADDAESLNLWRIGNGILLMLFAFMCVYFSYQYENTHSTFYKGLIEHSLMNGSNFSGSFITIIVSYSFPIAGALMVFFFPQSLMSRQFKRASSFLAASLALILISYFLTIPEQKKFLENCQDLNFQRADTVITFVDHLVSTKTKYMSFYIEYEDTNYKVKTNYVEGAAKNMPMRVIVQKGSLNIPVITMIEIKQDDFYWKRNFLGDTYNEMAYQYAGNGDLHRALKTIDKAIATDPTIANYYDSKGEFLLRNGDKDGAARMWMQVITLDSQFGNNNNTWLQKQLIKLGILRTPRRKETALINKTRKNNEESTNHWDTTNITSKWTEEHIVINGRDMGRWTILESSSVDPIIITYNYRTRDTAPKYGMLLAYQKEPARVLILVGERSKNNPGEYISVNPPMDKEVKVWFGQQQTFFHPKRCSDIHGVYELDETESRKFITNAKKKEKVTFVSVRRGSYVIVMHDF